MRRLVPVSCWEPHSFIYSIRWHFAHLTRRGSSRRRGKWSCSSREGATWSWWRSGCGPCWGSTCSRPSPTGACSSVSACASPSWGPPSWTWGARLAPRRSRSPGSSSPSSSSCWSAAVWEESSRKREWNAAFSPFFLCSGISSGRSKRFVFAHVLTKNPRS